MQLWELGKKSTRGVVSDPQWAWSQHRCARLSGGWTSGICLSPAASDFHHVTPAGGAGILCYRNACTPAQNLKKVKKEIQWGLRSCRLDCCPVDIVRVR